MDLPNAFGVFMVCFATTDVCQVAFLNLLTEGTD
jgi:hypothetical protein